MIKTNMSYVKRCCCSSELVLLWLQESHVQDCLLSNFCCSLLQLFLFLSIGYDLGIADSTVMSVR